MRQLQAKMQTGQLHENDDAAMVIVCTPSALSKTMGSLHPAGALYEKPVNIRRARDAHQAFVDVLERNGVTVADVRTILMANIDHSVGDRMALETLAFSCLKYTFCNDSTSTAIQAPVQQATTKAEKYYVSDAYKRMVIEEMGEQQLVDIIFTNPTVTISPSPRDTGFQASYQFDPLSNIIFVRDQQITTRKGIVMARLGSPQREREVDIMQFCFKKLGLNIIGRIPPPGHLEGGDFFPAGDKLSFIGIGPRSNQTAVEYLLKEDFIGTETVAVVKDELEKRQERMHLDTVFNVLSENCCLVLEEMVGENSPTRRVVDEYVYSPSPSADVTSLSTIGRYRLVRKDVEFSTYLREKGFSIIPISSEEQLNYGCNILNLGKGRIVSIEKNSARRIATSSLFSGTVEYLDFSAITCMYGGIHCASQVVLRNRASRLANGVSPSQTKY